MTDPVLPLLEDLDALRRSLVAMVSTATEQDWDLPATGLEGTCWETTEQLAENLFAYAGQFSALRPAFPGLWTAARGCAAR